MTLAIRLEAIARRLEAMALRLEAIASRLLEVFIFSHLRKTPEVPASHLTRSEQHCKEKATF